MLCASFNQGRMAAAATSWGSAKRDKERATLKSVSGETEVPNVFVSSAACVDMGGDETNQTRFVASRKHEVERKLESRQGRCYIEIHFCQVIVSQPSTRKTQSVKARPFLSYFLKQMVWTL